MLAGAFPAVASAATEEAKPFLAISPAKTRTFDSVTVEGSCGDASTPLVTSPGFAEPIKLGGYGRVGSKPGKYTATVKCESGKVLTAGFELVEYGQISVSPRQVRPGGNVTVTVWCPPGTGEFQAHSPGFASDIKMTYGEYPSGDGSGKGKAAQQPGEYVATISCKGAKVSTSFVIVDAPTTQPPTTTPPTSTQPPGTPRAPQVAVKPKGAPQTGGGFLAG